MQKVLLTAQALRSASWNGSSLLVLVLIALMLKTAIPCASAADTSFDLQRASVVVSARASETTREAAAELAEHLGRMTQQTVHVREGDGSEGIVVGTLADFPSLDPHLPQLDPQDPMAQENYLLRTSTRQLLILSTGEAGVMDAVWGFLHDLGHRQYFPGPLWEHVPTLDSTRIQMDRIETPAFVDRRIPHGGGLFDYNEKDTRAWYRRNRVGSGFVVAYTHVYDKIVNDYKQTFIDHPEYLALVDGQRTALQRDGNKFCISNPEVRQLAVKWAIEYLEKRPQSNGVSMEPSDGMGWCECQPCAQMGSISDRAYTLASQTAEAINAHFKTPKYVGIYAYGGHSPPPSPNVKVHPRVLVMVAKGFLRGGWTFNSLLREWEKRDNLMGVRDYLSVFQWTRDMPGEGRAARRDYPVTELPFMYEQGARLYCGEAEGNWGPAGFTYYLTARVLWDVQEAGKADDVFEKFLTDMFGQAAQPMRRYYDLIDGSQSPLLSEDLVGRMYRLLGEARQQASDPQVIQRIDHLIFYTRYVEMHRKYQQTSDKKERQAEFEKVIRFAWQIATTYMVHSREVQRVMHKYDRSLKIPKEAYYRLPMDRNAWAQNPPLSEDAAVVFLKEGIANNALLPFESRTYSRDLVPAAQKLGLKDTAPPGDFGGGGRGTQQLLTWVDQPGPLPLKAAGGQIVHYRNRGDARIKLFKADEVAGGEDEMPLAEASVPPDGEFYPLTLTTQENGLHMIQIQDGGDRTELQWPQGMPMTWHADLQTRASYPGTWTLVFYVPRDARTVSGYTDSNRGQILDGDGRKVLDLSEALDGKGFFSVSVQPGQAGRIWRLSNCKDKVMLMTVPPCLARSASELLLPREVVEADAR